MVIDLFAVMTKHSMMTDHATTRESQHIINLRLASDPSAEAKPEAIFAALVPHEQRRRLGQFFTPEPIARLMADWVGANSPSLILDPAVGPGIFPRIMAQRLTTAARMICVDIDSSALDIMQRGLSNSSFLQVEEKLGDFLIMPIVDRFDAIIANPPYLRHHAMTYDFDIFSSIGGSAGLSISRLTNSYILFLLRCATLLKPGGRMCFIVPAEWTNSNFGQPVKEHLLDSGLLRRMAYFNHAADIFGGALTTSCILFMESGHTASQTMPVHYVSSEIALEALTSLDALASAVPDVEVSRAALRASKKWDSLIRNGETKMPAGFVRLGDLATTKRGIATGANEFFHLPIEQASIAGISARHLQPCVGKAGDVKGHIFTDEDFERLKRNKGRSQLVTFGRELSMAERRYVQNGIVQGLHERHLLAARSPWYSMEKRVPAPVWAAVFNREKLRFIYNKARVHNLTTFHGIFPRNISEEQTVALVALLNSPTVQQLASEQVRVYGGGLRKFEPKDLLGIPVPDVRSASFSTLFALAEVLCRISSKSTDLESVALLAELDDLAAIAASEASQTPSMLF